MAEREKKLLFRIRLLIILFIIGLVLSGITAFPIETQLSVAVQNIGLFPEFMHGWLVTVYNAVKTTNANYPFLSYGTDWLAFAHLVIAVVFIGPLREPVRNIWVIQFGMLACIMVIPLALIAGLIRHIPFYWRLIDCSFGIIGIIPLFICYRLIKKLACMKLVNPK
jgi:hypothetical protein